MRAEDRQLLVDARLLLSQWELFSVFAEEVGPAIAEVVARIDSRLGDMDRGGDSDVGF